MSTVVDAVRANAHALAEPAIPTLQAPVPNPQSLVPNPQSLIDPQSPTLPARIALLGVGHVGGAVAERLRLPPLNSQFSVVSGLVRDTLRERPLAAHVPLTGNISHALDGGLDLVIEALGGLEPARTLVLSALERRIPVVTANKSLLATHGEELLDTAARAGVPLRYEAAVLAGVPFLGTFAHRSLARDLTGLCGIVNGTTNFILSRMCESRTSLDVALAEAQRLGYAEPQPASDVEGVDAAEKLCVLLRHFGGWSVLPDSFDVQGITAIEGDDLAAAAEFDGVIKPVVSADWLDGRLAAFAGPAFVPASHPLARINGVQNAVVLRNRTAGELLFAGPGAGPEVTAATLIDDAAEILQGSGGYARNRGGDDWKQATPVTPSSSWFVRISGGQLPPLTEIADHLSSYGVWLRRTSEQACNGQRRWFLTTGCAEARLADALGAFGDARCCRTVSIRVLAGD